MEEKEKYINPFTDYGFKRIFGEEANKDLLIDFLNQLLDINHKIKKITYKKLEQLPTIAEQRKAVFDLYCENEKGEKFIVELQKAKQDFFKDRSVFYSTFPIREQAEKGSEWDYELKAVFTIGVLNFCFKDDKKDETIVTEVKLMDTKKNKIFYDKLTYIYIQIPNFKKEEKDLVTRFDKWLYVLKNLHRFQDLPDVLQEKIFKKLFKISEIANFNQIELDSYEESKKQYRDLNNVVNTAERKGIVKGENKKAIEIAKSLKQHGVDVKIIFKSTGLSKEEIEKL